MDEKAVVGSEASERSAPQPILDAQARDRREFLKQVGQVSVAVPAAALLLSVNARSAMGTIRQYGGGNQTPDPRPIDLPDRPDRPLREGIRAWIRFLTRWLG